MANKGARKYRGPYGKESPASRKIFKRKVRAQMRDALRHDREPDRTKGTQGWLSW